jgi:hypothetical protein
MQALTSLLALFAPVTASVKHDGRDHRHPLHRRQHGLMSLSVASDPPMTSAVAGLPPLGAPTISSYVFPTTVIQVPIATVCPDTPSSSAAFSILPVSSMLASKSTGWVSIQVNATALLPNGSPTVFLSATSTTSLLAPSTSPAPTDAFDDETARIVMGKNGCQTVYSAVTSQWCSSIIEPAGILPVTVTECDQMVTFSSQRFDACSTTATPSPSSLSATHGPMAYYLAHCKW